MFPQRRKALCSPCSLCFTQKTEEMTRIIISTLCLLQSVCGLAQENAVYVENLKSIQVKANGTWGEPPLMILHSNNYVEISFDDLQHNFIRYTYTITHCNADWTPSDINRNEYMDGFADNKIEDYKQSMSTMMDYNHYTLCLPNDDVKLLISGNYKVTIYEEGEDEPVAEACFSIIEPRVGVEVSVSGNTDIDTWAQHQQLEFNINYKGYEVRNPVDEFYPIVVQNRRWDNHVEELKPTYMRTNQVVYSHNKSLIFEAGNEYRRFEILDEHVPTMRVDQMEYHDPYYHATIFTDEQRTNYLFDKDQDGRYYVRNNDNIDNETESDYFLTHFTLKMPPVAGGDIYLNGELTNNRIAEEYRMEYNRITKAYEKMLPLKQGSYNYQYLYVRDGETTGHTLQTEGNFHQTENEYYVYVYSRPFGGRYDKLIGFGKK